MASILGYDSAEELMFRVTDIGKQLYVSEDTRNEFIALMRTQKVVSGFEVQFFRKDAADLGLPSGQAGYLKKGNW